MSRLAVVLPGGDHGLDVPSDVPSDVHRSRPSPRRRSPGASGSPDDASLTRPGETGGVLTLSATVLDAPDAQTLARFYRDLLGWPLEEDKPGWATLRAPGGGAGLSFQTAAGYRAPTWPTTVGRQQMMAHLDIEVDDLDAACAHAVGLGATVADHQPQEHVRVCLDPAGHPFCLWVRTPPDQAAPTSSR